MDNDTGVDCLSLIAHYHQLATDPAQLGYQFAEAEKPGTAATVSLPLDQLPITWIEPLSEGEQSQQRIETQQDLKAERARQEQLSAAIEEVLHQIASLTAELSSRTLNEIEESERQITALMQELNKVREINAKQILYAPVTGRVHQLAVHTLGGVVTEAQPLGGVAAGDDGQCGSKDRAAAVD